VQPFVDGTNSLQSGTADLELQGGWLLSRSSERSLLSQQSSFPQPGLARYFGSEGLLIKRTQYISEKKGKHYI